MKIRKYSMHLIIAVFLLASIPSLQALSDDNTVKVIYQTSFTTDPHWLTNNPSTNYWDPNLGMYHFSNEPSTGGYAYIPVDYERGSFTFEYDLILTRIDDGATFRFGLYYVASPGDNGRQAVRSEQPACGSRDGAKCL